MVSYNKASSILSSIVALGAKGASAHTLPKDFDVEAFAAELKQLRVNAAAGQNGRGPQGTDEAGGNGNIVLGGSTVETFLDGHEFIAPGNNDSRGPCPFINVMANHGFINRTGRGINVSSIPALAPVLFDLPEGMFRLPANMAIFDGVVDVTPNGETLLEIERLWNRPGEERDISQVFPNPGLRWTPERLLREPSEGFEANEEETFLDFRYNIDEGLLQQLLALNPGDVLTQANHNTHIKNRVLASCNNMDDPAGFSFFFLSKHDFDNAAHQYTLPVLILGEDVDDFTTAPKSHIEGLWREFRLPDGYAPRSVRFGDAFDMGHYTEQLAMFAEKNLKTAFAAHDQCSAPLSSCGGNSECPDGFHCDGGLFSGFCLQDEEVGENCNEDSDCLSDSCGGGFGCSLRNACTCQPPRAAVE